MAISDLSDVDMSMIRTNMLKKPHSEIALMIDAKVEDVALYISSVVEGTGIITHQMKLDKGRAERKALSKPKEPKPKVATKLQEEEKKEVKKKSNVEAINASIKRNYSIGNERTYKTITRDLSTMQMIRIDSKTVIFIKPGEDPETAKHQYLARENQKKKKLKE